MNSLSRLPRGPRTLEIENFAHEELIITWRTVRPFVEELEIVHSGDDDILLLCLSDQRRLIKWARSAAEEEVADDALGL